MNDVTNKRREYDRAKEDPTLPDDVKAAKKVIADGAKTVGNGSFGKTGEDRMKHQSVTYVEEGKLTRAFNDAYFANSEMVDDETFEVLKHKRKVKQTMPIHVSIAIYQLAKLRMLQFYYDCIDRFVAREDFQYMYMDTDSAYLVLSTKTLEEAIRPELSEVWEEEKKFWFPTYAPVPGFDEYGDNRTPGLFKAEYDDGKRMVALASKLYIVDKGLLGSEQKLSCKGVSKRHNKEILVYDVYKKVLKECVLVKGVNKGLRKLKVGDEKVATMKKYTVTKIGITFYYDKRRVLEDGVTTVPLLF